MSSPFRKIQKNAESYMIKNYYETMTPKMYQEGIQNAIRVTEEKCLKTYEMNLKQLTNQYNDGIRNAALIAMDTLSVEMIYELGNILHCYDEEPTNLDQKIDVVQGLYETALNAIQEYGTDKYKTDKQAQKVFNKKKKIIKEMFGMEMRNGKKKSK